MISIDNANLEPNRRWVLRLAVGTSVEVELYLTAADAAARENIVASGSTSGLGSALPVVLAQVAAMPVISLFNEAISWHLLVSGTVGDTVAVFKMGPFADLDDVSHAIYRNGDLISTRAKAEIDAHTHAVFSSRLSLGAHLTDVEPGEIARLNSSRRGVDVLMQIMGHTIAGEQNDSGESKLTSELMVARYVTLKR